MRSPHTTMKSSPCSPQLQKARAQQRRPNAAKNLKKNFFKWQKKNSGKEKMIHVVCREENRSDAKTWTWFPSRQATRESWQRKHLTQYQAHSVHFINIDPPPQRRRQLQQQPACRRPRRDAKCFHALFIHSSEQRQGAGAIIIYTFQPR